MIYDHIKNLDTYSAISEDIRIGLEFLRDAKPDIENGVYQLNPRVKAIVSEYETKPQNENGYEAHRQYIDIQYTLKGQERVSCLPIERMREEKAYSEETDAAFYSAPVPPQEMTIGDGYFAVFFPQDGHMPQLCVNTPQTVKKVVVKVRCW